MLQPKHRKNYPRGSKNANINAAALAAGLR
jgi:hypothetical protein